MMGLSKSVGSKSGAPLPNVSNERAFVVLENRLLLLFLALITVTTIAAFVLEAASKKSIIIPAIIHLGPLTLFAGLGVMAAIWAWFLTRTHMGVTIRILPELIEFEQHGRVELIYYSEIVRIHFSYWVFLGRGFSITTTQGKRFLFTVGFTNIDAILSAVAANHPDWVSNKERTRIRQSDLLKEFMSDHLVRSKKSIVVLKYVVVPSAVYAAYAVVIARGQQLRVLFSALPGFVFSAGVFALLIWWCILFAFRARLERMEAGRDRTTAAAHAARGLVTTFNIAYFALVVLFLPTFVRVALFGK